MVMLLLLDELCELLNGVGVVVDGLAELVLLFAVIIVLLRILPHQKNTARDRKSAGRDQVDDVVHACTSLTHPGLDV